MHVCLDYQPAVAQRAGIGRYTRQLARQLMPFFGAEDRLRLFYLDFSRKAEAPAVPGAELHPWRLLPGALIQQLWKRVGGPPFDALAGAADLYHFTNFIIPPLRRGKAVVSVHDMSFARLPDCAEDRNRAYLASQLERTLRRADAIITISHFSAGEIAALHPETQGRIHVTHLGIDETFRRPPEAEIAAFRRKRGLERPYLLSVGTIEPRKNFPLLVEAFDALDRDDIDLVVAGRQGWHCEPILDSFRNARRAGQIRHLDDVTDAELPALYAGARIFALASRYEGFGFPPLEAMACGTPVVTAPAGAVAEVVGDAACIVAANEAGAWRAALAGLLDDPERCAQLTAAGLGQVRRYRWAETARQTLNVYRHVLGLQGVEGAA